MTADPPSSPSPPYRRIRSVLASPVVLAATLVVAVLLVVVPWGWALAVNAPYVAWLVGIDADIYFDATARWLGGGYWYLPRQLAGPYGIEYGDVLYPPQILYLTVPFQVLPFALWWLIPAGMVAAGLRAMRPPRWTWPLLVLCVAWPLSLEEIIKGNPVIWVVGIAAVCLARGWPLTLVLLKPSLFPFALPGITRRAWWILLAVFVAAAIPLWELAMDYPAVVLNSRGGGILYSVRDVPLLLLPFIAAAATGRLRVPSAVRTRLQGGKGEPLGERINETP